MGGTSLYNCIHRATCKKDELLCDSSDTMSGQEAMSQPKPDILDVNQTKRRGKLLQVVEIACGKAGGQGP